MDDLEVNELIETVNNWDEQTRREFDIVLTFLIWRFTDGKPFKMVRFAPKEEIVMGIDDLYKIRRNIAETTKPNLFNRLFLK